MIDVSIPGFGRLQLDYLVLDYNGTLAVDGELIPGVAQSLEALSKDVEIHVLTADTFGKVKQAMGGLPCRVSILPEGNQAEGKRDYVVELGGQRTACIGNGRNDRLMLADAALGIAVVLAEGASAAAVSSADIVCTTILDALALLNSPLRMTATLRS